MHRRKKDVMETLRIRRSANRPCFYDMIIIEMKIVGPQSKSFKLFSKHGATQTTIKFYIWVCAFLTFLYNRS